MARVPVLTCYITQEGVNYLLDKRITLEWDEQALREVAERIRQRLAEIQFRELAQFINPNLTLSL